MWYTPSVIIKLWVKVILLISPSLVLPPEWNLEAFKFWLVCVLLCQKNYNLGHNFWTIWFSDFMVGMHTLILKVEYLKKLLVWTLLLLVASVFLVRMVSPFNGELSFVMAAVLWSDRLVNKKLRKFNHRRKTFKVSFWTNKWYLHRFIFRNFLL